MWGRGLAVDLSMGQVLIFISSTDNSPERMLLARKVFVWQKGHASTKPAESI